MNFSFSSFKDGLKSLTNMLANNRAGSNTNRLYSLAISNDELNSIYKLGIGRKIVNIKSSNIYKEGFSAEGDIGVETLKFIDKKLLRELKKATEYMMAFGRGVVVIIDKNSNPIEPLKSVNLQTVRFKAFSGAKVTVQIDSSLNELDEMYNEPFYYRIGTQVIHHSRVMDFQYYQPVEDDKSSYNYGGISEFELIYSQLINDSVIERAIPTLVEKISTMFYKIKDFKNKLQQKQEKHLVDYFHRLENLRSIYGAGLLDSEDDTKTETQNLSGLDSVDTITLRRLSLVTGIPLSWLVGENVKGLNSSGKTEETIFWSMVKNLGNDFILPILNKKLEFMGLTPVWFNEQYQSTPTERADYETKVLNNALLIQQLGLDDIGYIKDRGVEVEVKKGFDEIFNEDEDAE
ncbi:anti-CBASS protein Acb1 family protein [Aliarcobacter lanthieri]|uniref:anti-CBASS protein Acb1 family protein n=1 Tax=Aliarcobacter lanthieri TaxID=1355374 RepID=UPI00047B5734|nr:anti-CBASS Acb1 family protein [Aliarcobacter lanthieri]